MPQNIPLLQVNNPPRNISKSLFTLTATRPQQRPIQPPEQETNLLNLLDMAFLQFGGIHRLRDTHHPTSSVNTGIIRASCDVVDEIKDIRIKYLDYTYGTRIGRASLDEVEAAINRFNARKAWLDTFSSANTVVEVMFSECPTVADEINEHRNILIN